MENEERTDTGETLSESMPMTEDVLLTERTFVSESTSPLTGDESGQTVTQEGGTAEMNIPVNTQDTAPGKQAAEQADAGPADQPVTMAVTTGTNQATKGLPTQTDTEENMYGAQAEALREVYPTFDLEREMKDPAFRGLVCGEVRPTLAQAYALCHGEELMAEAIRMAVETAVSEAESRMTAHIAARGLRPCENGMSTRGAVRMHPSVDHLTREDRAMLARRAGRGESIRL